MPVLIDILDFWYHDVFYSNKIDVQNMNASTMIAAAYFVTQTSFWRPMGTYVRALEEWQAGIPSVTSLGWGCSTVTEMSIAKGAEDMAGCSGAAGSGFPNLTQHILIYHSIFQLSPNKS